MDFDFLAELGKMTPKIAEGAKIYIFGAGGHWDFISKQFKFLVNIDINEYVDGFIDSDLYKQGTVFYGKRVYALSDVDLSNILILISVAAWPENKKILQQLLPYGLHHMNAVFCIGWNFDLLMRYEYERLMQFKDKYRGKRCFIIGNGPSLLASDLDRLKNEITFATNRIYLIFDKTEWRPTYYVCEEDVLFKQIQQDIQKHIECPAFYSLDSILDLDDFNLSNFFYFYLEHRYQWRPDRKPGFSTEPFIIQCGQTVTYACLQIAAYMGFSDMYLLGVDNTTNHGVKLNGELVSNCMERTHFTNNYIPTDIITSQIDVANIAYTEARVYTESLNTRILNATRGGELEAFERISFDRLFM